MARRRRRARVVAGPQRGARRRAGRFSYLDMQARRDHIIAGDYINNAGAQVATNGWNGGPIVIAPAAQVAYQAVVIPAAATAINAPPSVGQCEVDQVEGSLYLLTPTAAGVYFIGVGIYISKYDTRTATWGIRFPSTSAADASRDDWLMVKGLVLTLPLPANVTDPMVIELKLALPHPVILCGGEALHVCVDNASSSAGSISVVPYLRTRISSIV